MSSRRGVWIIPRLGESGLPMDISMICRKFYFMKWLLPGRMFANRLKSAINGRFNHSFYGLEPDYNPGAQLCAVNDYAMGKIVSGEILIRPAVARMTSHGVQFRDGRIVDDVDIVIFATGCNV